MQCNFPGIDRVCTFFNLRLCVPDHTRDCVFLFCFISHLLFLMDAFLTRDMNNIDLFDLS